MKMTVQKFVEVLGYNLTSHQKQIFHRFDKVFDLAEVAEQEIGRAKERHPGKAPELHKAFLMLEPGPFTTLHRDVYRSHARELLERIAKGDDTRLGTKAEVLMALSAQSLRAPLNRDAIELACKLTADIMPGVERATLLPRARARESHKGALKDLLKRFRRQLRKPQRLPYEDRSS